MLAALKGISKKVEKNKFVRVGFLEKSKYPNGIHVAQVAAWINWGTKTAPPRPFFSGMVADKKGGWPKKLAAVLKAAEYDIDKALALMGEGIKKQLTAAIIDMETPELSPVTLMLRKMLIDNPNLEVTGATVGEAARRVADGESSAGASTKVGVFTGHMLNSTDWDIPE